MRLKTTYFPNHKSLPQRHQDSFAVRGVAFIRWHFWDIVMDGGEMIASLAFETLPSNSNHVIM